MKKLFLAAVLMLPLFTFAAVNPILPNYYTTNASPAGPSTNAYIVSTNDWVHAQRYTNTSVGQQGVWASYRLSGTSPRIDLAVYDTNKVYAVSITNSGFLFTIVNPGQVFAFTNVTGTVTVIPSTALWMGLGGGTGPAGPQGPAGSGTDTNINLWAQSYGGAGVVTNNQLDVTFLNGEFEDNLTVGAALDVHGIIYGSGSGLTNIFGNVQFTNAGPSYSVTNLGLVYTWMNTNGGSSAVGVTNGSPSLTSYSAAQGMVEFSGFGSDTYGALRNPIADFGATNSFDGATLRDMGGFLRDDIYYIYYIGLSNSTPAGSDYKTAIALLTNSVTRVASKQAWGKAGVIITTNMCVTTPVCQAMISPDGFYDTNTGLSHIYVTCATNGASGYYLGTVAHIGEFIVASNADLTVSANYVWQTNTFPLDGIPESGTMETNDGCYAANLVKAVDQTNGVTYVLFYTTAGANASWLQRSMVSTSPSGPFTKQGNTGMGIYGGIPVEEANVFQLPSGGWVNFSDYPADDRLGNIVWTCTNAVPTNGWLQCTYYNTNLWQNRLLNQGSSKIIPMPDGRYLYTYGANTNVAGAPNNSEPKIYSALLTLNKKNDISFNYAVQANVLIVCTTNQDTAGYIYDQATSGFNYSAGQLIVPYKGNVAIGGAPLEHFSHPASAQLEVGGGVMRVTGNGDYKAGVNFGRFGDTNDTSRVGTPKGDGDVYVEAYGDLWFGFGTETVQRGTTTKGTYRHQTATTWTWPAMNVATNTAAMQLLGGAGSYATTNSIALAAGGVTNIWAINAGAYVTATAVAFTIKNRDQTTIYTSPTLTTTVYVHLQPGWSVNAASGLAGTLLPE